MARYQAYLEADGVPHKPGLSAFLGFLDASLRGDGEAREYLTSGFCARNYRR